MIAKKNLAIVVIIVLFIVFSASLSFKAKNTTSSKFQTSSCQGKSQGDRCDDGRFCTHIDRCDNLGICKGIPLDAPCDDGNPCTVEDRCLPIAGGVCEGLSKCNDRNPCTIDSCSNGECSYVNNNDSCNDNNVCTIFDICSNSQCVGREACNDADPNTTDSCREVNDGPRCTHTPISQATSSSGSSSTSSGSSSSTSEGTSTSSSGTSSSEGTSTETSANIELIEFFIDDLSFLQRDIQRQFKESKIRVLGSLPNRVASIVKQLKSAVEGDSNTCKNNLQKAIEALEKVISLVKSRGCSGKRITICIPQGIVGEYVLEFETILDELKSEVSVDDNEDKIPDVCGSIDSVSTVSNDDSLPVINNISPTSAPVGSSVTITGNNFTDVISVKFGNINAAITTSASDSTKITAVVPPGSGTVQVSIITSIGTSNALSFTYPPPIINSINPGSASAGSSITILGVNFTDVTSVKFGNTEASFNVISSTEITAIVPQNVQPVTGLVQILVSTPSSTSIPYQNFTYITN